MISKKMIAASLMFALLFTSHSFGDEWGASIESRWTAFVAQEVTALLDNTGGEVLYGSVDGGSFWLVLWDPNAEELEIRKNGSTISDLVQWQEANVIYFEGAFSSSGDPRLVGTVGVNKNDELLVEIQSRDEAGFRFTIDGAGITATSICRCTTPGGGGPTTVCTNTQCDDAADCGPAGGGKYCNWRVAI